MAEGLPHDGNARYLRGIAGNSGLFGSSDGVFRLASEYLAGVGELLTSTEIEEATAPVAADLHQVRALAWQHALTPSCSAGRHLGSGAYGHVGFTAKQSQCTTSASNGKPHHPHGTPFTMDCHDGR